MCKSLSCCSGSSRHLEIPTFCHGGSSEVCVLHFEHSFTPLSYYLIFPMVALPGRSWFPSPNHTQFLALLSFFLSELKALHQSQTWGWFRAVLEEAVFVLWACWAGPSARQMSALIQTRAEAEADMVLQGAGVMCSAASCWSDTLQRQEVERAIHSRRNEIWAGWVA